MGILANVGAHSGLQNAIGQQEVLKLLPVLFEPGVIQAFFNTESLQGGWLAHFDHKFAALGRHIFADLDYPVLWMLEFIGLEYGRCIRPRKEHFTRHQIEKEASETEYI